jgi:hypothetical protein
VALSGSALQILWEWIDVAPTDPPIPVVRIDRSALEGVIDEVGCASKSFPSRNRRHERDILPDTLAPFPPFTPRPIVDSADRSGLLEGLVQHVTHVPLAFSLDLVRFTVEAILRRDATAAPEMLGLDALLELPLHSTETEEPPVAVSSPIAAPRMSARRLLSSQKHTVALELHNVPQLAPAVLRTPSIDRLLRSTGGPLRSSSNRLQPLAAAHAVQNVCSDTMASSRLSSDQAGSPIGARSDRASAEEESIEAFFAG